ncbi:hypothetical protein [Phocaeicola faecicola]|uniref:hypothetical protein n=1 Tax=Phocaeicola faecicola TaxID=2739389 RepID=UPI0015E6DDA2|nr:hypothetical protein [Phocaeicola faecicola]
MKKLIYLLLMMVPVLLGACSKDDEGGEIGDVTLLYGTWDPVHVTGHEGVGGTYEEWDMDVVAASNTCDPSRIIIGESSLEFHYYEDGWHLGRSFSGWRLEGDRLYIGTEADGWGSMKVISLTATELVMEDSDDDYWERVTYHKVAN